MNEHRYTCYRCGRVIKNRHYGPDGNYYGASCITKYTIPFSPARLMLNGILLSHNMDAIVIPYTRKIEFNNALDELFINNDGTSLAEFLISCHKRIL